MKYNISILHMYLLVIEYRCQIKDIYIFMEEIMTIEEASEKYCIPIKILKEYESMELCKTVKELWANGIMMMKI